MNKYKDFMSKLLELVLPTDIVRYCIQPFLLPDNKQIKADFARCLMELEYETLDTCACFVTICRNRITRLHYCDKDKKFPTFHLFGMMDKQIKRQSDLPQCVFCLVNNKRSNNTCFEGHVYLHYIE